MLDMETEIVDSLEMIQFEGSVSGSSYEDLTATGRIVRYVAVHAPKNGPYALDFGRYIRASFDGGSKYITVSRGYYVGFSGTPNNGTVRVEGDGVSGNVGYEVVMGVDAL